MAPPAKRRRTRAAAAAESETEPVPQQEVEGRTEENENESAQTQDKVHEEVATEEKTDAKSDEGESKAQKAVDRLARFKALQARAKNSSETNLKEATLESQRLASDPSQLKTLNRKRDVAAQKLLKAEVEDAGGDFERKRAWDWTVDESERWDKRMRKKEAHRDNTAFRDYHQESNKLYKTQLRNIDPDVERYEKDKLALIEKSAASGGLDIVETETGELIAVDRDGTFYSTADSTSFAQNKPDKASVDRLVQDLNRAEERRLKKRKDRMAQGDDNTDVTYINEKNKQFNQKLSRFYDKYTAEIRDSFERGTKV